MLNYSIAGYFVTNRAVPFERKIKCHVHGPVQTTVRL